MSVTSFPAATSSPCPHSLSVSAVHAPCVHFAVFCLTPSPQGANHRLEISNPQDAETIQNTLRLSDLSTDDEDRVHNTMRQYEKKIDGLMTEVGSLKNEVRSTQMWNVFADEVLHVVMYLSTL